MTTPSTPRPRPRLPFTRDPSAPSNDEGRGPRPWGRRAAEAGRAGRERAWEGFARLDVLLDPLTRRVRAVLATVTSLGWAVVVAALASMAVGYAMGWGEARYAGLALFALFLLSCLLTIGRTNLRVALEVQPERVVVGESAAARIVVTNMARTPVLPLGLEFPVGAAIARFALPSLVAGGSHEELVIIPTNQRGVVPVGPATTQRGDPFGLVRREIAWTTTLELFVHPRTVPLEPVGSGLLRDLEGHPTNDVSMSDLAFHTLRDYSPGDDRRYIHWRSTAKRLSTSGSSGQFLVRQFLDTRRSHIAVVLDCQPAAYVNEDEFETAVSVGASVAVRALRDEMTLTIVAGDHAATEPPPHAALDTFSRAQLGDVVLNEAAARATRLSPTVSVVVLVTGPITEFAQLRRAAAQFPPEANVLAVRVESGAAKTLRETSGLTMLTVGSLADLPIVLGGGQLR